MFGIFLGDDENRQRFHVKFSSAKVVPAVNGTSMDIFREVLGLDAEAMLEAEFKPPSLHSDVVYLDDDLLINLGSIGGAYVMAGIDRPLTSIG